MCRCNVNQLPITMLACVYLINCVPIELKSKCTFYIVYYLSIYTNSVYDLMV